MVEGLKRYSVATGCWSLFAGVASEAWSPQSRMRDETPNVALNPASCVRDEHQSTFTQSHFGLVCS